MRPRLTPAHSFLVAAGAFALALTWAFGPGPPHGRPIRVPEGATLRGIGDLLVEAGAIRSAAAFVLLGRIMGAERALRAGIFTVPPRSTPGQIVHLLVEGKMDRHEVTIPEGRTVWETAAILMRDAGVDSTRFAAAAQDSTVAAGFGVRRPSLEGYLFPDTYDIPPGTPVEQVLTKLVCKAQEVFAEGLAARAPPAPLAPDEVVVLASIVEAEARVPAERPRIAAVYLNRLRMGMRLEADPTVAYALRERRRLYYKDLEVDSPWNTYRAAGLPPTAICSPGRGSLAAVLAADSTSSDLYFVARGDGTHIFSRTAEEHERAVRLVRSIEEAGGAGGTAESLLPAGAAAPGGGRPGPIEARALGSGRAGHAEGGAGGGR